jgi:hypothetical protein
MGAVTCAPCDAGYYSEGYAVNCTACDPGFYSGNAASVCIECPAGTYNDLRGQGVCFSCSGESYSRAKSTSCELCVKGAVANVPTIVFFLRCIIEMHK